MSATYPMHSLVLERYDAPIHLLVTDLVLPGMDGRELAARVARVRPRTATLLTTGYCDRMPSAEESASGLLAFLEKPFTGRTLLTKARALLDRRS